LGYDTQILYGPPGGLDANNRLNEITLHDAQRAPRPPWLERVWRAWMSTRGRTAIPITPTGEIVGPPGQASTHTLWAAQDIFQRANFGLRVNGRFTSVSFAESPDARRPDAVHWTCPLPMRDPGARNFYTIHDLIPLRLPYATLENKRMFHGLCARICREADHVVTVSETSRADIIRMFGVDENRITNTYQAVDIPGSLRDRPAAEVSGDIEGMFNLPWKGYFLFFGSIEPKKNLPRIIEAYLSANVRDPLIIVGADAWLAANETALLYDDIIRMGKVSDGVWRRADRIRRYDFLPFPVLVNLIRGAKGVLFPSLYEGFGLPVLEAMQLGTPVLASTGGALPEVAGDGALLVDPFDVQAIKRGIIALDADEGLREALAERGAARAEHFSVRAYEERLGKLYGQLV
jgi:glycosyltransferase involved in cell wall biosynthesis